MSEPTTPQADVTGAQQPQAGTPTVQATQEPTNTQNPTQPNTVEELPAWAQKLIKEANAEAAKHRKEKADAAIQSEQAQAEKLKQQGEFKTLAEQREARIKELEPQLDTVNQRLERFNKLTLDRAKAEIKDWPEKVAALLPKGDSIDALDYLEAVEKYRPLVDELRANSAPGARPNQPRPAGQGQPGTPLVSATRRF
jgi:hypothetical protein